MPDIRPAQREVDVHHLREERPLLDPRGPDLSQPRLVSLAAGFRAGVASERMLAYEFLQGCEPQLDRKDAELLFTLATPELPPDRASRVASLLACGANPNILVGEPPRLCPLYFAWLSVEEEATSLTCLLGARADPALKLPAAVDWCDDKTVGWTLVAALATAVSSSLCCSAT